MFQHAGQEHLKKRWFESLHLPRSSDKAIKWIDHSIFMIAFLGPAFTVPQAIHIYATQSAEGISAISWIAYFVFSFFWLAYGIVHKEKVIIFSNSLWIILTGTIVFGTLIYS